MTVCQAPLCERTFKGAGSQAFCRSRRCQDARHDLMVQIGAHLEFSDSCHLWRGAGGKQPALHVGPASKRVSVPRFVWMWHRGFPGDGVSVWRECAQNLCCRIEHLILSSQGWDPANRTLRSEWRATAYQGKRGELQALTKQQSDDARHPWATCDRNLVLMGIGSTTPDTRGHDREDDRFDHAQSRLEESLGHWTSADEHLAQLTAERLLSAPHPVARLVASVVSGKRLGPDQTESLRRAYADAQNALLAPARTPTLIDWVVGGSQQGSSR